MPEITHEDILVLVYQKGETRYSDLTEAFVETGKCARQTLTNYKKNLEASGKLQKIISGYTRRPVYIIPERVKPEVEALIKKREIKEKIDQLSPEEIRRITFFVDGAYGRITGELSREREHYITQKKVIHPDKQTLEILLGSELDLQFVKKKSESEIIQAIGKWLTPIILYTIIQELKPGEKWVQTLPDLIQKVMKLVKQKDLDKFEATLREKYSEHLVPKYMFILPEERIPLIDSLDDIIGHIKTHEYLDSYEEEMKRKGKPPYDKLKGLS